MVPLPCEFPSSRAEVIGCPQKGRAGAGPAVTRGPLTPTCPAHTTLFQGSLSCFVEWLLRPPGYPTWTLRRHPDASTPHPLPSPPGLLGRQRCHRDSSEVLEPVCRSSPSPAGAFPFDSRRAPGKSLSDHISFLVMSFQYLLVFFTVKSSPDRACGAPQPHLLPPSFHGSPLATLAS